MSATPGPNQRAPRRQWPASEKRRIVELTLCAGVSVRAIASEYGVHPTSLHHWKALYRAGKLDAQKKSVKSASRVPVPAASATFVPVRLVPAVRRSQPAPSADAGAGCSIVQLMLASGATLRIETGALDVALVCALVAELQR